MSEQSLQVWLPLVTSEGSDEPIEVETEEDGKLLLSSVAAQFPGAIGLRFRNKETGALRGVKLHNEKLCPPFDGGWGPGPYVVLTNNISKRKADSLSDGEESSIASSSHSGSSKNAKLDSDHLAPKTNDLIVLNLNFSTTEQDVREFFNQFGPLKMCQLKCKDNGKSKGYAFIHFEDPEAQRKVTMQRHLIADRWCDVKLPNSQDKSGFKETDSARDYKICIRRLEDSVSKEDLTSHFEKFGRITDVFYPRPSRGFAFITFVEKNVAKSLIGLEHVIGGISVAIMEPQAKPKFDPSGAPVNQPYQQMGKDRHSGNDRGGNGQWGSWQQPPQQQGFGFGSGFSQSNNQQPQQRHQQQRAPWSGGGRGSNGAWS